MITTLIFFCQSALAQQSTTSLQGNISVHLEPDKTTYVTGELIYLDCTVVNQTDQTLEASLLRSDDGLKLLVQDATGEIVSGPPRGFRMGPTPTTEIGPKSSLVSTINLVRYGNGDEWTGSMRDFIPGLYAISATFMGVPSNTVKIKIVSRSPSQQNQHQRIVSLYRPKRVSDEEAVRTLRSLVVENPNSVYIPNMYWQMLFHLSYGDHAAQSESTALEFIEKFPDHGATGIALMYLNKAIQRQLSVPLRQSPSEDQQHLIESKLLRVKSRYPNRRIARLVDEEIDKARTWWAQLK